MTDNEANVRGTTSSAFGTSNTRADKTAYREAGYTVACWSLVSC